MQAQEKDAALKIQVYDLKSAVSKLQRKNEKLTEQIKRLEEHLGLSPLPPTDFDFSFPPSLLAPVVDSPELQPESEKPAEKAVPALKGRTRKVINKYLKGVKS